MAYGAFADTKSRYRDLEELVDYREYDGAWTTWFEELASADANSSYAQQKVMESITLRLALADVESASSCA